MRGASTIPRRRRLSAFDVSRIEEKTCELVARQLGHADVQMVCEGLWPLRADRRRARSTGEGRGPTRRPEVDEMGRPVGTPPQNDSSQPPVGDWLVDSRGGTRTLDPGIMSAVL